MSDTPTLEEIAESSGRTPEELERILDKTIFANDDSEVVTGTVSQVLHPGDEEHYAAIGAASKLLEQGYSAAAIRTDEYPLPLSIPHNSLVSLVFWLIPFVDQSDWTRRVYLREPDIEEGDRVEFETTETSVVVKSEDVLIASECGR